MEIINVGYQYSHPSEFGISRPGGSGDYLLLLLWTDAYFVLDGVRHTAQANSILLYRKGTPQHYGAVGKTYVNDWVHFEMCEADLAKIEAWKIPMDTIVYMRDVTELSGLVKSIFNETYSENPYKKETSGLFLELLLLEIAKRIRSHAPQKHDIHEKKLTDLRNAIYCAPEQNWSIDALCSRLNLSRSYLQHLYKSRFGTSIIADITNSRMERAKYLLAGTDLPVGEIAQTCGYTNDVHFMRMFRKLSGMTPTQYRRKTAVSQLEMEKSKMHVPYTL